MGYLNINITREMKLLLIVMTTRNIIYDYNKYFKISEQRKQKLSRKYLFYEDLHNFLIFILLFFKAVSLAWWS